MFSSLPPRILPRWCRLRPSCFYSPPRFFVTARATLFQFSGFAGCFVPEFRNSLSVSRNNPMRGSRSYAQLCVVVLRAFIFEPLLTVASRIIVTKYWDVGRERTTCNCLPLLFAEKLYVAHASGFLRVVGRQRECFLRQKLTFLTILCRSQFNVDILGEKL